MTKSTVAAFFLLMLMNNCSFNDKVSKGDNIVIDAKLLKARLVNFKNPTYMNNIAWLEYYVELKNTREFPVALCKNEGYLILKTTSKEFTDSLEVFFGKNMIGPKEKDTIRLTDYFVGKPKEISEIHWLNPEQIFFICSTGQKGSDIQDSVIYVRSFIIKKDTHFTYHID